MVSSHQIVKKMEKELLSVLSSLKQGDYWRMMQKVATTVTAKKEVREKTS